MMPKKSVVKTKIWSFQTINSRILPDTLTGMTANGATIFAVYPSTIAGSFDVLSYEEK
jgi:hypothetical protein